jgi:hypothetical protein
VIKLIRPSDQNDPGSLPLEKSKEESKEESFTGPPAATGTEIVSLPIGKNPTLGSQVWRAYAETFHEVHGVPPTLNVQDADEVKATRAMCAKIARRVGEDAPAVAEFYVRHKDQFLVREAHPLEMLVQKAKRMHKEWRTGCAVTTTTARRTEEASEQDDVGKRVLAKFLAARGDVR